MKWICTDPDNDQWRLDEGQDLWRDTVFTFKEGNREETIDLNSYTREEIQNYISAYGYVALGHHYYFIDGTDEEIDNSIVAECIFEMEAEPQPATETGDNSLSDAVN